jgi:Uma2 family endonuclease
LGPKQVIMNATLTKPMTADDLLAMPSDDYRYELVKGELVRMPPTGFDHGKVAMNIGATLHDYVKRNKLGQVCAAETGFILRQQPDTVRAPDVAFIRREQLEKIGSQKGYWIGAPDLAVEVTSPGDTISEVEEKVEEWMGAGTRMVWVISPKLHTVTVYRSLTDIVTLSEKDTLDGGDVVPGFQINIDEIFAS